jgi:hypothetical protein
LVLLKILDTPRVVKDAENLLDLNLGSWFYEKVESLKPVLPISAGSVVPHSIVESLLPRKHEMPSILRALIKPRLHKKSNSVVSLF